MLTNDNCDGRQTYLTKLNIRQKDNTYPNLWVRYCLFLISVINKSTTYYKYAVDLFFYLQKIGLIAWNYW